MKKENEDPELTPACLPSRSPSSPGKTSLRLLPTPMPLMLIVLLPARLLRSSGATNGERRQERKTWRACCSGKRWWPGSASARTNAGWLDLWLFELFALPHRRGGMTVGAELGSWAVRGGPFRVAFKVTPNVRPSTVVWLSKQETINVPTAQEWHEQLNSNAARHEGSVVAVGCQRAESTSNIDNKTIYAF